MNISRKTLHRGSYFVKCVGGWMDGGNVLRDEMDREVVG
jgi:hypothetical protein